MPTDLPPLRIRVASGKAGFDERLDIAAAGRPVTFLVGDAPSGMAGETIYVDGGPHNVA